MRHSPFLFFQATMLLGQLSGFSINGFSSDCPVLTTIPPDNCPQQEPRRHIHFRTRLEPFSWQRGMCTLTSSASPEAVHNAHPNGILLGHDTCSRMRDSPFLLSQAALLLGQLS
ncbi:hypothetical protein MRX96_028034 [Rhipicephalus microplus]